ncbi:MAG: helix-turn-helix domain-containing protein [Candidatus Gastranaerophilaceae bacterium]
MKNLYNRIEYILRNNFKKPNISLYEFAKSVGASPSKFAEIKSGKVKTLSQNTALEISKQYGFSFKWILTGEGEIFEERNDLARNNNQEIVKNIENSFKNFGQIQQVNNLLDSEMAKILGISENKYIKIATGKEKPTIDILIKLKENFNVNIDHFLFGKIEAKLPQHDENAAESLGLSKDEIIKLKQILKNY